MKEPSEDYTELEEAPKQKPVELYRVWRGAGDQLNINTWFYTSGDVPVVFGGKTYVPATLNRGLVKFDSSLSVTTLDIQAGYIENPVIEFIAINPIEILWISIMRLHRDQVPLEADVIFLGQIKSVSFKGVQAIINCFGFEHFLQMVVPKWRFQLTCNHNLFDSKPKLLKSGYFPGTAIPFKGTATVTLDSTKTVLTSATFDTYDDGYFTLGEVSYGVESRAIVGHSGDHITIAYPMRELGIGAPPYIVDAYPGDDRRIETCRNKFYNLINFLGFPFTPVENPMVRT